MEKQRKYSYLLKGLIYGLALWFKTPLYIGGGSKLNQRLGLSLKVWFKPY